MVKADPLGWPGLIGKCRSILQQLIRLVDLIKWRALFIDLISVGSLEGSLAVLMMSLVLYHCS